jgi:stage III sporulation protein AB
MLQIIGKCLVLLGMTAFGLQQAMGLRRRVSCLREFQSALERLERELAFALLPVPVLLAQMRDGTRGSAYQFFACCEERFCQRGEERLEEIWKDELMGQSLPIQEEDKSLLQEIGSILGRYDGDSQRLAFQRIHGRLEEVIAHAKEEAERMGKVYSALGITIGMFCIIML